VKIKLDFVTNSSSTSFVYISDRELTKAAFLQAAGVDPNGPVADIFSEMYRVLRERVASGDKISSSEEADGLAASHDFTPEVIEKVRTAVRAGKTVISGSLSSESDLAESILCMAIFEIESDSFYINAYNNYW
jgi:hypothetical protein